MWKWAKLYYALLGEVCMQLGQHKTANIEAGLNFLNMISDETSKFVVNSNRIKRVNHTVILSR